MTIGVVWIQGQVESVLDKLSDKRLLSYFAGQCARAAVEYAGITDEKILHALDVVERCGLGEDFDTSYLCKVKKYVRVLRTRGARPAVYNSVSYAIISCYAVNRYYNTVSAMRSAERVLGVRDGHFRSLLFKCIKERMSRVEQILILGEEL